MTTSQREVWHWVEVCPSGATKASLEVACKAQEVANALEGKAVAVVIWRDDPSRGPEGVLEDLASYGVNKVYLLRYGPSPSTRARSWCPPPWEYHPLVFPRELSRAAERLGPEVLLLPASVNGMDLASRVAARLGTGLTAHCAELEVRKIGGVPLLVQMVPGFGENVMVQIVCPEKRPQMATVRPGVFPLPDKGNGSGASGGEGCKLDVVQIEGSWDEGDDRVEILEHLPDEEKGDDLEGAEVVVAGGSGMRALGGFDPLWRLAGLLGAAVGGTRPAVDKGWIGPERMIGQSGKTVSPKLFMSFGASGAMHFVTGFLKSKFIFAVTNDPAAPILKICDVGVIGDLKEVMPVLFQSLEGDRADQSP